LTSEGQPLKQNTRSVQTAALRQTDRQILVTSVKWLSHLMATAGANVAKWNDGEKQFK